MNRLFQKRRRLDGGLHNYAKCDRLRAEATMEGGEKNAGDARVLNIINRVFHSLVSGFSVQK
jgi:hypothetical protein